MADFLTFANLMDQTQRLVKHFKKGQEDMVKHVLNMVYLDEVMTCDDLYQLFWMVDHDDSLASKAASAIAGISVAATSEVTTVAAHGLVAGDIVSIYDVVGMTEVNNRTFQVGAVGSTTTFKLLDLDGTAISSAAYTAWSSGGVVNHRGVALATTGKNVEKVISARWFGESKLDPIDIKELENSSAFWDSGTGCPARYWHRKAYSAAGVETNQLLWFQSADSARDLRYWFEKRAPVLSDDAHVPMLPPRFHYAIVAGTVMRLAEFNVQVDNQLVWPGIYKEQLDALRSYNRAYWEKIQTENREAPYLL